MELRHLNYFVAIAEEGSFSGAAERLWVAQPGLSTQIRRLEAELGIRLFERRPRGVELTEAGELFLERARAVLAAADTALATGSDLESGLVGTIRLGIATGAVWPRLQELLERFSYERPRVELTVFESHAGALLRDLHAGSLDAVVGPLTDGEPQLQRKRLGQAPWLVLAGAGHRLAAGSGPVAAAELDGETLVVTDHRDGAGYDRAIEETLAELGVTATLRRGGPGPALFASVAAGTAVALATSPLAVAGGVRARPLDAAAAVDFALLWRDDQPGPALDEFIRTAGASAPAARPALRAVA